MDAGNQAPLLKAREYGTKPKYPYHKEEVYTAETGAGATKKTWTIDIPWASIPIKRLPSLTSNARMGQVAKDTVT